VQLRNGNLEVSYANLIILALTHFFCSVVESVKFTNFITEANLLKKSLYLFSIPWLSEVVFGDSVLWEVRWPHNVCCLGFISVVLVISYALKCFIWNIVSYGGDSKRSVDIILVSYHISAVRLDGFAKIMVGLHIFFTWLAVDASRGIPGVFTLNVPDAVNKFVTSIRLSLS